MAAEAYESALELGFPDDSPTSWNLALTYLELERFAEAQAQFETYLELNPDRGGRSPALPRRAPAASLHPLRTADLTRPFVSVIMVA